MLSDAQLQQILLPPSEQARRLLILAGYGSPAMVHRHLELLENHGREDVVVELVLGMVAQDGVGRAAHREYRRLQTSGRFSCQYIIDRPPVHTKLYIWVDAFGNPISAWLGSANYSQGALLTYGTLEALDTTLPVPALEYFHEVSSRSVSCLDDNIEARVAIVDDLRLYRPGRRQVAAQPPAPVAGQRPELAGLDSVSLSLLQANGEIHQKSGLNWGQRDGRDRNQAYIPVPSNVARAGFFPPRGVHFTMITDDGEAFDCAIAQDGDKAIESTESNAILGRYFRDRLGVASGTFVSKQDVEAYGRTNVVIYRLDDETFYMDFSV